MRTLLDEKFAPITSQIGYLHAPLDVVADAMAEWSSSLYQHVSVDRSPGDFPEALRQLEPLLGGARPRMLLVSVQGGCTAYFDCALRGTDAEGVIARLSRTLSCMGLAITTVPHTIGLPGVERGRAGGLKFQLFGPVQTHFLNYVRTLSLTFDGKRWVFDATGTRQPFEDAQAYTAKRVRDRFTSAMLEAYCQELGIDAFNAEAYGPQSALITRDVPRPSGGAVMTLQEVQAWLEIKPGLAAALPG